MEYNYYEAVENDVREYLAELELEEIEEIMDDLYGELNLRDSITGAPSGSYTFSTWEAEEYLCHNFSLLQEAMDEWSFSKLPESAELCDVMIREYVLGQIDLEAICDEILKKELESQIKAYLKYEGLGENELYGKDVLIGLMYGETDDGDPLQVSANADDMTIIIEALGETKTIPFDSYIEMIDYIKTSCWNYFYEIAEGFYNDVKWNEFEAKREMERDALYV